MPFFCAHGIAPTLSYLRSLAELLGPDHPFFALQVKGLDGRTTPKSRTEELASDYLRDVRLIQPSGPYQLGGFSFGGVVAFEMAQQLKADGEQVDLLALIDTHFPQTPDYLPARPRLAAAAYRMVGAIERHLIDLRELGYRRYLVSCRNYWREGVMRRVSRWTRRWTGRAAFGQWDISDATRNVILASIEAERTYHPRKYQGRIVLFLGSEWSVERQDTRLAWDQVADDGLEVHIVPGDHMSLRNLAHMSVLAEKLRARMNAPKS